MFESPEQLIAKWRANNCPPYFSFGSGPRVLITAGIHGDEPAGCYALDKILCDYSYLDNCPAQVDVLPLINHSGFLLGRRETASGSDLNRAFRGPATIFDQFDVKYVKEFLVRKEPYKLFLSMHEDVDRESFYLYNTGVGGHKIINDIFSTVKKQGISLYNGIDEISAGDSAVNKLVIEGYVRAPLEKESDGTLEDYVVRTKRAPRAITIELPGKRALNERVNLGISIIKTVLNNMSAS